MDRERLIITFIISVLYCFSIWPLQTTIIALIIIAGYFAFTKATNFNVQVRGEERRRKEALNSAKVYLGHYSDIWRNLRLSNPNCYLNLGVDGLTITGFEKRPIGPRPRTFTVLRSQVHPTVEVWNMFCKSFRYNTTYDGLVEACRRYHLIIEEKIPEDSPNTASEKKEEKVIPPEKLVDINNCSEEDLINLPGISTIMAKKTIKRREEIGGFKTVDEFFTFLKIKSHMQENISPLITLSELRGYKKVDKTQERSIDL